MRSKPIRIQSQRSTNHSSHGADYMMAASLDNYSQRQLFRRETPHHHHPERQGIYHAGYMERRIATTSPSPRHNATVVATVTPVMANLAPNCGTTTPSPPLRENPKVSLLTELMSVLGMVPEKEPEPSLSSPGVPHVPDAVFETCEHTMPASSGVEPTTHHHHQHVWTTVYCVLLDDTLYMYQNQTVAESEAAVQEREVYRSGSRTSATIANNNPHADTPTIADIRLPLDSVESVRSTGQEYGNHSVELAGRNTLILRAPDSAQMNEWMFQFLRSIASELRNLMDSARSTTTGVEYSPIRRRILSSTASYSPRLSLTHGHGRSRRRYHELEDNHDHVLPFPMDGSNNNQNQHHNNHRLVTPLLPRRDCVEPELCMSQTTAPETEIPKPYLPPHRRGQYTARSARANANHNNNNNNNNKEPEDQNNTTRLGGCADPGFVAGSIMDDQFIPRKASTLRKVRSEPFGYCGDGVDIGAFSECGPAKDTNEDSFMISTNLHRSFDRPVWDEALSSKLFSIFDGHGGDHAARFAAEQLTKYMYRESLLWARADRIHGLESILENALLNLDSAFCNFCQEGGRDWDSGSTALVAILIEKKLIIGNIGDARGIIGRTVDSAQEVCRLQAVGWNELSSNHGYGNPGRHLWKEVTDIHSPSRADEAERIALAGGWITHEQEIPVSQLKRMDLDDDEVYNIVQRCFADRNENSSSNKASAPNRVLEISRTCGDLAVSRALGDRYYKASYNRPKENDEGLLIWDSSHLFLSYPDKHDRLIAGDLVSNQPEFISEEVGNASCEFLLLACDGLWDVLDADDAYRITRDLLFEKGFSSKKAAARLAELAVHLGSSDNVTVIVVRFL